MRFALTIAAIVAPTLVSSAPVMKSRSPNNDNDNDNPIDTDTTSTSPSIPYQLGDPWPRLKEHPIWPGWELGLPPPTHPLPKWPPMPTPEELEKIQKHHDWLRNHNWNRTGELLEQTVPPEFLLDLETEIREAAVKGDFEFEIGSGGLMAKERKRGVAEDGDTDSAEINVTPNEIFSMPGPVLPTEELPNVTKPTRNQEKRSEDVALSRPDTILDAPHRMPYPSGTTDKLQKYWNQHNPDDRKVRPEDFHCVMGSKKPECRKSRYPSPWEYEHSRRSVAGVIDTDEGRFRHPGKEERQDRIYGPLGGLLEGESQVGEDLSRREMTPVEVFNMPGPVVPTEEFPKVIVPEDHKEEKRSEDVILMPPSSFTEAPHSNAINMEVEIRKLRDCLSRIHPSILGLSVDAIIENVKKTNGDGIAEWLRDEASKAVTANADWYYYEHLKGMTECNPRIMGLAN